jgi:prepilin-type processing-associated H-X9-DG protein
MSNMKQLGLATVQYVQDYDEVMYTAGELSMFPGLIYPYVKARASFTCPNDSYTTTVGGFTVVSYALNSNLAKLNARQMVMPVVTVLYFESSGQAGDVVAPSHSNNPGWPYKSAQACDFRNQSNACVKDSWLETGPLGGVCADPVGASPLQDRCVQHSGYKLFWDPAFPDGWHNSGSNYSFMDGHAKWLKGTNVSTGKYANNPTDSHTTGGFTADGTSTAQSKGGATFSYI